VRVIAAATLVLALTVPAVASAAELEPAPSPWEVTLGGRFIYTTGYTTWNNQAASGSPNVLSELTWRGVDSPVTEVHAEAVFRQRLVLQGTLGIGPIIGGTFIDNDYAADDRQNRFSSTRSDATGEVLIYFTVDVGVRLVSWAQPHSRVIGYVQAFTGFQFWTEYYEASGANGTVSIPDDVVVVEETFTFQSIRLGAEAMVPVYRGLALRLRGVYLPWTRSELRDKHPLRSDLEQDPSFKATAEGGTGYQLEGALLYDLGNRFSVEAGYRYWRIESGDGTLKARTTSGDIKSKLNEIIIERYGPWVGVTYRF
jgi:Protochlamydia outer membrane protein